MGITIDKKLSILIIPGLFPFPPNDGGKICIYGFVDSLRHQHDIHLFLGVYNESQKKLVEIYKNKLENVTIHCIELFSTELTLEQKIKKYIHRILKRKIISSDIFDDATFTTPVLFHSKAFIFSLSELISKINFDIVQTEYTSMLNIVNIIPKNIKKIYVEIESRHAVLYDYGVAKNVNPIYLKYVCDNAKDIELAYMRKYDAVFTLNDEDNTYLTKQLNGVKVFTSPFPVLDKDISELDTLKKINKIVFVGSEGHEPNYDAVLWLAKSILPGLNLKNNLKLYVTGNWSKNTIQLIHSINENIEFTGFIDNIANFLNGSISVIPIRIGGGGLRTKIIYSMAAGSPVVTTTLAAYGLVKEAKNAYLLADTDKEFIDQINVIISNSDLAQQLIKNGKNIIQQFYRQKVVSDKRNKFYFEILNEAKLSF